MRSIGELMQELGFNKDASEDSKKAFIRHLIKAAAESKSPAERNSQPIQNSVQQSDQRPEEPQQLSFDFSESKPRAG